MVTFLPFTQKTGQDANFPLVQFSLSPILGLVSMFKTFMPGHLCMVTFLHFIQESAKKNLPNWITHLCVAVVNRLGNSLSHQ